MEPFELDRKRRAERARKKSRGARNQAKREAAHQRQVELLYGKASPLEQAITHGQTVISHPGLEGQPALAAYFSQLISHFFALYQRPVAAPVAPAPLPRRYERVPDDWALRFSHPDPFGPLRCSTATSVFGICGIEWFLKEIERRHKLFGVDLGPTRKMKSGTRAHSKMADLELEVISSFRRQGYRIPTYQRALADPRADMVYLPEKRFQTTVNWRGHQVPLSGQPDRVLGAGGDQPLIVAEAKTRLFGSTLLVGYTAQALLYCRILADVAPDREVYFLLTESTKPFTRQDLEPLLDKDTPSFLERCARYREQGTKIRVVEPFNDMARTLADHFISVLLDGRADPYKLPAATSKEICEKYSCPFSARGCPHYLHLNQQSS